MASNAPPATVDWRPYHATALALTIALAMNLATHNGLWLAYTLTGTVVFLVLVTLVRTGRLVLARRAMWMIGLAAALHYIGGSLSGLHQVGGPNGLYYAFPWWDNVVHALGSAAIAIGASAWLLPILPQRRKTAVFLAVCLANLVGVGVELYEFAQYVWFHTVDQGFYTNTMVDLWSNLTGATMGAILYVRGEPRPAPAQAEEPPATPAS